MVGGALLGAGYVASRKIDAADDAAAGDDGPTTSEGCSVGITRRTAFKVALAGAAAAVAAAGVGGVAHAPAPADAVGLLYDTTQVHRLQGVRGRVPRGQRPRRPTRARRGGLYHAPLDLNENTKTVIKLYNDGDGTGRS